jgi:hypothetical protein
MRTRAGTLYLGRRTRSISTNKRQKKKIIMQEIVSQVAVIAKTTMKMKKCENME